MRRLRPRPLWLFLIALLGLSTWSACGDDGPAGYSATKAPPNHDDEKDAGPDDPEDAGGASGSSGGTAGKGGNGSAGMGGGDAGEAGEGGEGGGGEGGESGEGGEGGEGGSGPIELPDSPANPWVAFIELGPAFGKLIFIKADGSDLHAYSGGTLSESDPSWSPDGTKLAFTAFHETEGAQLHVLDFEAGSDDVLDIDLGSMSRPRFTPDGDTIVFAGAESSGDESALYRTDVEDGGATAITEPEQGDGGHDIAPDGTVYFARKLDNGSFDIFSIDVDADPSDDPVRVTTGSTILNGLAVHPAGTHVLYAKKIALTSQLKERSLGDGTERNIGEEGDEDAAYFAGADKLVLSRDSFDADAEIAVTDADGVLDERLTDTDPAFETAPAVSSVESDDIDVEQF